jgi:RNA polymerase sigma-70 factor (ECF subfamily)
VDQKSFEKLVLSQREVQYEFARRLARSRSEADDIVQESQVRAWRAWPSWDPGTDDPELERARLITWLQKIMRNVFLNRRASRAAHYRKMDKFRLEGLHGGWKEEGSRRDLPIERETLRARVQAAIAELPDFQRNTLSLYYDQGYSTYEIARMLGINPVTTQTRLVRAREALRPILEERLEGEDVSGRARKNPAAHRPRRRKPLQSVQAETDRVEGVVGETVGDA